VAGIVKATGLDIDVKLGERIPDEVFEKFPAFAKDLRPPGRRRRRRAFTRWLSRSKSTSSRSSSGYQSSFCSNRFVGGGGIAELASTTFSMSLDGLIAGPEEGRRQPRLESAGGAA
jgi:hypothetical protein